MSRYLGFGVTFCAAVISATAMAQPTGGLSDLVGARAAGGETQLEARGYSFVTTNTVRDTKWSYWYNQRLRQCAQVATSNGRYSAINAVPEENCRAAADGPSRPDYPQQPDYGRPEAERPRGESLTLICYGSGSGPAAQSYSGYSYNSRSKRFEPQFGTTLGREGFASDVQVEIWNGRGRIHLAGKLVSPIHSGGTDGWWPIDELVVTPHRITGRYRLNGMNKPRLDIDRRTRTIRINAATSFVGRCDAGNWRGQDF